MSQHDCHQRHSSGGCTSCEASAGSSERRIPFGVAGQLSRPEPALHPQPPAALPVLPGRTCWRRQVTYLASSHPSLRLCRCRHCPPLLPPHGTRKPVAWRGLAWFGQVGARALDSAALSSIGKVGLGASEGVIDETHEGSRSAAARADLQIDHRPSHAAFRRCGMVGTWGRCCPGTQAAHPAARGRQGAPC